MTLLQCLNFAEINFIKDTRSVRGIIRLPSNCRDGFGNCVCFLYGSLPSAETESIWSSRTWSPKPFKLVSVQNWIVAKKQS